MIAERADRDWRPITYAEAVAAAGAIGQGLPERGLGPGRPQHDDAARVDPDGVVALLAGSAGQPKRARSGTNFAASIVPQPLARS
jgi:hypothetical protein